MLVFITYIGREREREYVVVQTVRARTTTTRKTSRANLGERKEKREKEVLQILMAASLSLSALIKACLHVCLENMGYFDAHLIMYLCVALNLQSFQMSIIFLCPMV